MKLNQTVNILDKQVKPRVAKEFAEVHQRSGKGDLFTGFSRTYEPIKEDGEKLPPESRRVQHTAKESLAKAKALLSDLLNLSGERDFANTIAKADIAIEGNVLVSGAPVPFLLLVEKQLKHELRPFVDALPVLNPDFEWRLDPSTGLFKTPEPVRNHKTKKEPVVITKAPATDKHPAQVELTYEDKTVGYWSKTEFSGAMPLPEKQAILDRIDALSRAVKAAIQEANGINAPKSDTGDKLLGFLFEGKK